MTRRLREELLRLLKRGRLRLNKACRLGCNAHQVEWIRRALLLEVGSIRTSFANNEKWPLSSAKDIPISVRIEHSRLCLLNRMEEVYHRVIIRRRRWLGLGG